MDTATQILDKMPSVLAFLLIILGGFGVMGWFFLERENKIRLQFAENDVKKEKKIIELGEKIDFLEKKGLEKDKRINQLEAELLELKTLIKSKFASI